MKFDSEALVEKLHNLPDTTRWVVGLSGGVDSVVLLHSLVAANLPEPIVAVHIHHGLSDNADDWLTHCQTLCYELDVPLTVARVNLKNEGRGMEDAARQARYDVYAGSMEQGDMLLLAHHQDDQAETLLFRLMRGAGPYGLGAMDECRAFASGYIGRPLLSFSKEQLIDYAKANGLSWVEDESNFNEEYDRNYLRNSVMPLLEARWPHFAKRWQQTALACQQADQMSHDLSLLDLERCDEQKERGGYSLCFASLCLMPRYRRHNLLRNWVRSRGYSIMEHKHLHEVEKQFIESSASGAEVQWSGTALRLYGERLYLTRPGNTEWQHHPLHWSGDRTLELPDGSQLHQQPTVGGLRKANGGFEIRWREGGERCQPQDRAHSQTLKKLLQEYGLEPWLRDRVPLIYNNDMLVAVGDLWVCKGFVAEPSEPGIQIRWQLPDR